MQSLTLKYRPTVFEDVVGQEVNNKFLSTLIKRGQIGKNLILYGPYGSGKTSLNRIYARALNCINPTKLGSPCNICDNCELFFKKQYPDYIELDGANRGGKDKIKELVEIAQSYPYIGKYRIICVDECHNLTKQSWDTLLKLIEEPPPYLIFIFTTTEYNKVPDTIQSRCYDLEVKLLDSIISKKYLIEICNKELFKYEDKALGFLSYISKGHPRDLVKNLEKVLYFGDITLENTLTIFNLDYIQSLVKIYKAIFIKENLVEVLRHIKDWYVAPGKIFEELKIFIIALYCSKYKNINVQLSDIFSCIPKQDIDEIWNNLQIIVKEFNIKVEDLFKVIFEVFNKSGVTSYIDLYHFVIKLYNSIYNHHLGDKSKIINRVKINNISNKKEGRKFIKGYNKVNNLNNEIKGGNLYKHSLLSYGFSFRKNDEVNIKLV